MSSRKVKGSAAVYVRFVNSRPPAIPQVAVSVQGNRMRLLFALFCLQISPLVLLFSGRRRKGKGPKD